LRLGLHWPHFFHRRSSPAPRPSPAEPPVTRPPALDAHGGGSGFDPPPASGEAPLTVNLHQVNGFTPAERAKLDQAVVLLGKVLNSAEFKSAVLGHTFAGKQQFASNGGLSNAQVYAAIRAGKENFEAAGDHEVDLNLSVRNFSFWQRNVVGFTSESTPEITMNRNFFDRYSPAEIAGNMAHEWMHKLGFEHDFRATAQRPDSVPYAVGDLVERLAGQL
jgi:hypothetical protein